VDLAIAHVSANIQELLGIPAADAIGTELTTVFGTAQARQIALAVRSGDLVTPSPMQFTLEVHGQALLFDCVLQRSASAVIVELEPRNPHCEDNRDDPFEFHQRIARMQRAPDLDALFCAAAAEVQRLSGFDRTMVYRFDEDWNGEVVAEATNGADTPVKYLGLHFPASDIPEQARRLYLANPLRLIPDVNYVPVPLVPQRDRSGNPVDLSATILRSVSPVHIEYLQNMGVAATLTISIVTGGRLWGLIACHHPRPRHIDYRTRSACLLLGNLLAWQSALRLEMLGLQGQLRSKELIAAVGDGLRRHDDLITGLCSTSKELLDLFSAQGFVVVTQGVLRRVGLVPASDWIVAEIAKKLRSFADVGVAWNHRIGRLMPDAVQVPPSASGALLVTVSEAGDEYLLFFRDEVLKTVRWGGDMRTPVTEFAGQIHPRASFALWEETVRGESSPWSDGDANFARCLRQRVLERAKAIDRDRAQERIRYLAHTDLLTQLPNRSSLHEQLQHAIDNAKRNNGTAAVLFVDLDHFKLINDTFGHPTGDRVLQVSAARMQRCLRAHDFVSRHGGDEFVIILTDLANAGGADVVANKIVSSIAEPIVVTDCPDLYVTASVGIAVFPNEGQDAESLLQHADLAMYQVKDGGRNGFEHFVQEEVRPTYARIYLERRIRHGLENAEFVPYYQPIICLKTGRLTSMEALARWRHPRRGLLLPVEFIAIAEDSGTILSMGKDMLRAACSEAARWHAISGNTAPHIAVNVSPRQFRDGGFIRTMTEILEETGLPPTSLELEITESVLVADQPSTVGSLRALADRGIGIAIDDFGRGYSSLSYLTRLPVDTLKIDKSFLESLTSGPREATIVRAIIALGHSLGLSVVAEGVETADPLAFLRNEGCDAIQGFVVERPLPASEVAGFIEHFDPIRFAAATPSRAEP
jgi:diguanylate cyclase (GGDEF)-like protein